MFERIDDEKLRETALFISKLFLAGIVFRAILYLEPDTYLLQLYLADITHRILVLTGLNIERQGIYLIGAEKSFIVVRDCLGWKSISVFIALIFASVKNFRRHLKTVLAGVLLLSAVNIIRVVTTVYLSELGLISFDVIHTVLWTWGLTAVVFLTWLYWLKNTDRV